MNEPPLGPHRSDRPRPETDPENVLPEAEAERRVIALLHRADELHAELRHLDRLGLAQPGSVLARDDVATAPYPISLQARDSLDVARDHLEAVAAMVTGVRPYATFTLLRTAIENASAAVWLLCGSSTEERQNRLWRVVVGGLDDELKHRRTIGRIPSGSSDDNERQRRAEAKRRRIKLAGGRFTYSETVRTCSDLAASSDRARVVLAGPGNSADVGRGKGMSVFAAWQACSGFAHGRLWPILGYLHRESVSRDDGVVTLMVTADSRILMDILWCTVEVYQLAIASLTAAGSADVDWPADVL